ncbi:MAG: hypothetical protein IPH65_17180 [Dehalococcoidia bacterium]|uniref:hypothetical protein n=1 Tax=Candidatus Amarobacter glycogenicus TaxID=3140699 RepID=UPI0031350B3E|nr:hypothetical protein [Dehalococcoidia bacterium]
MRPSSTSTPATSASRSSRTSPADDDDINNEPQDNCISRVLYESEDPGEVDIEAFAYAGCEGPGCGEENYTKVAFVVYYMKINTINVSLVTQVSKPSHNSSWYADYAPGNPWDASKDDADNAADWNVSKDLLVRGRVTGWFTNSNPSGRAADTSNPLNVLPANRWVMPQDWPLLAGGPGDPADGTDATGTAEQFRPYYDIMFAPNNTRGLAAPDAGRHRLHGPDIRRDRQHRRGLACGAHSRCIVLRPPGWPRDLHRRLTSPGP